MIVTPLFASFTSGLLGFSMFLVSLFLILLILVQRGRGGGLTGALGGPGGQSAFGTKAGDLFTRITSFVALGWITLCAFTMWLLGPDTVSQAVSSGPTVSASPADPAASSKDFIDLGGADEAKKKADSPSSNVELTPSTGPAAPAVIEPAKTEPAPAPAEPAKTEAAAPAEPAAAATPEVKPE